MTSVCSHSLVTACCRTGQKKKSVNPVLVLHLLSETASLTKKKKKAVNIITSEVRIAELLNIGLCH